MKTSGVIVRFLSLLDVALILLGILLLALTQSTMSIEQEKNVAGSSDNMSPIDQLNVVYLYAGWKGDEKGKCYLLGADMKIEREISTTSKDDILSTIEKHEDENRPSTLLILLFDSNGWFDSWPDDKIKKLEDAWGIRVTPLYNVSIVP
ncbi:MAG: hypothetical protein JNK90_02900 [Planctomycetaceae bacterium]|nr:hypothetical protein [Planctomycetaceae bacterium]